MSNGQRLPIDVWKAVFKVGSLLGGGSLAEEESESRAAPAGVL